jgi:peptidoglycan-associated lipoprotein
MSRTFSFAIPLIAAPLLAACAGQQREPPPPKPVVSEYASWDRTGPGRSTVSSDLGAPLPRFSGSDRSSLVIDERIRSACGIIPAAHFAFDSDEIEGDAASVLNDLSDCFVSGPLAGRRLRIIGHTDPRGEPYHNLVLGQKRATGVAFYLNARGVDMLNVHTMTMGSKEAVGTDEEGWAQDRRVEIFLEDL